MRRNSFKVKLVMAAGILFGLSLSLLSSYTIYHVRHKSVKNAENELRMALEHEVEGITHMINRKFDLIRNVRETFNVSIEHGKFDRLVAVDILKKSLLQHKDLLAVFTYTEKNGFDKKDNAFKGHTYFGETGIFLPYIYHDDKGEIAWQPVNLADIEVFKKGLDITSGERFVDPYFYKVAKDSVLMVSGTVPIHIDNKFGEVGFDYGIDFIQNQMLALKDTLLHGGIECAVVSDNGIFAANTKKPEIVGENIAKHFDQERIKKITQLTKKELYYAHDTLRIFVPVKFGKTNNVWRFVIEVPQAEIYAETQAMVNTLIVVSIAILLMSLSLLYLFASRLSKPIVDLAEKTRVVESGDISFTVAYRRDDEIGLLGKSFDAMISKLREMIGTIHKGAENIVTGSEQISSSAQSISQGANEQAAATEEVLSSIEEMLSSISRNSDNAQQANEIAKRAAVNIEEGQQASKDSVSSMRLISDKILVISKIAEKTGLLAINASIEAARAGQAGKGFSTVATEVRKLAEESTHAANEIIELTQQSLLVVEQSGEKLLTTVPIVLQTSEIIEQIADVSSEQNLSISQIRSAINELNLVTMQNTSTSEELATSSEELTTQAEQLKDTIAFFKVEKEDRDDQIQNMEEQIALLTASLASLKKPQKEMNVDTYARKRKLLDKKGVDLNMSDSSDYEEFN